MSVREREERWRLYRGRDIFCKCAGINNYCSSAQPVLSHATGGASAQVYTTSNYTCDPGFQTSGVAGTPYSQCLPDTASAGQWSSPAFECVGAPRVASPILSLFLKFEVSSEYCNVSLQKYSVALRAAFDNYCNPGTAPASVANANTPLPMTQVNATTSFTCNSGYESSIAPATPSYSCIVNVTGVGGGVWSPATVTDTCNRMLQHIILASISMPFNYIVIM